MLTADDRFAIHDLINLHGHLTDSGDFDGLHALFDEQVRYDVSAYGYGVLVGLTAGREAALELGDDNPVGHHVTNIVLEEIEDGVVHARSKGLGVRTDGSVGSVTYQDVVRRGTDGWKITQRVVRPRVKPLQP